MSNTVHYENGPVAYLSESGSAVYFSLSPSAAGTTGKQYTKGTAAPVKQMQSALKVAAWGEDNRFPQNIEQQMAYCGIGKAALDWKARALWGNGIIPGRIKEETIDDSGNAKEIFEPLKRAGNETIYNFIESRGFYRFFLEYLQDWTWYGNCFPEIILDLTGKVITGFVHQESNDCRFKQMDENGLMDTVYLSKLWGSVHSQYVKFDPDKRLAGLAENPKQLTEVDNKYVKALDCIDMYNPVESLKGIAESMKKRKGLKSAILPVNYPSPNKTYYQLAFWDGARLSGWVEIVSKVPSLVKQMYNKAFKIKYHIQVPEQYFHKIYGQTEWTKMEAAKKREARLELLKKFEDFLSPDENAYKSFLSFFDSDPVSKQEYGLLKIEEIKDTNTVDKDLITSSFGNNEILTAMQVHPTLFGSTVVGSGSQRTGGSDQREAYLIYTSLLNLERNVLLEPLYLVRDFNREVGGMKEWAADITFRFRDVVLTTLDKGKGTTKTVS